MANDTAVAAAMAALDAFMAALNRGDEAGVNDAFNFPHVRIASGRVAIFERRGDYRLDTFRARAGEGWHHSAWDERTVVQSGPDKVHFAVVFSRYAADGRRLGRFPSVWIVTCVDGHWGVQARSSFAA
ncbi:MAG: hypothetical protein ACK4QW_10855 [Alphaproteobacteria bacterium]